MGIVNCRDCKHWRCPSEIDRRCKQREDGAKYCTRIPGVDGNYASDGDGLPRMEGWDDGGQSGAFESVDLVTPPDFGCVLGGRKEAT